MLLDWIKELRFRLKKLFVVHGEEAAANILAQKARDNLELLLKCQIMVIG